MSARFIIFYTILSLIYILSDIYLFRKWKRFIQERNGSSWWYTSVGVIAIVMILAFWGIGWYRYTTGRTDGLVAISLALIAIWYLGKLPAVIFHLVKDAFRLCKYLYTRSLAWLTRSNAPEAQPDPTAVQVPTSSRRAFLETAGWAAAGVPVLFLGNGFLRTVYDFRITRLDIPISGLPTALDGLTITQLSDIHAGSFVSQNPVQELRRIVQEVKADMITITGDWVNSHPSELSLVFPELNKLSAPLGVYGCLGNHDHYMSSANHQKLLQDLGQTNINILVNQNRILKIDGATLQIAGTDNTGLRQNYADLEAALQGCIPENPTILLAHDPTFWDKSVRAQTQVDLMLAGHTHGGQIGIHILGEDYSVARVIYNQWAGLYREGNQHLYINRGVGTTAFPIRTAVEPEITVLTLRRA